MTNDDKQFLKEFLLGARNFILIVALVFLLYAIMNGAANWLDAQPTPLEQKFEVVDEYKGCEVVRYAPDNTATYKYFLYCDSSQGGTQIPQMP